MSRIRVSHIFQAIFCKPFFFIDYFIGFLVFQCDCCRFRFISCQIHRIAIVFAWILYVVLDWFWHFGKLHGGLQFSHLPGSRVDLTIGYGIDCVCISPANGFFGTIDHLIHNNIDLPVYVLGYFHVVEFLTGIIYSHFINLYYIFSLQAVVSIGHHQIQLIGFIILLHLIRYIITGHYFRQTALQKSVCTIVKSIYYILFLNDFQTVFSCQIRFTNNGIV